MTYHTKPTGLASVAALAVGAMIAFAPMKAEAAVIRLEDLRTGSGITPDVDVVIDTSTTPGTLTNAQFEGAFGGLDEVFVRVTPNENGNESVLSTVSINTKGLGHMRITASENDFGIGANFPDASSLRFSVTSSSLSSGGLPSAAAYVDDDNNLEGQATQIGSTLSLTGPISAGSKTAETSGKGTLENPFAITSVFEINHTTQNAVTSFDATVAVSAVPLPASALLLLGGLGGLGGLSALRRRKRAA